MEISLPNTTPTPQRTFIPFDVVRIDVLYEALVCIRQDIEHYFETVSDDGIHEDQFLCIECTKYGMFQFQMLKILQESGGKTSGHAPFLALQEYPEIENEYCEETWTQNLAFFRAERNLWRLMWLDWMILELEEILDEDSKS